MKHFEIDFGGADQVTHVRLTNLAGTVEGLRLDALEGRHPVVDATHAFEIRLARYGPDAEERFAVRLKNVSATGGAPIQGFRIERPDDPTFGLVDTFEPLTGDAGYFVCIEGCVDDLGPAVDSTRQVWLASGPGLDPGREVSSILGRSFKAETPLATFLSGFTFEVTFVDGVVHTFGYDEMAIEAGRLFQKFPYESPTPTEVGPRPADYLEWKLRSTITFSDPPSVGTGHTPSVGGRLSPTSQNFVEEGMHVEAFWVPNDSSAFVPGHFHNLEEGYEKSHGFESAVGQGPDRQGIYLERVDGGTFDLERLDGRPEGPQGATTIGISPTYDPSLPIAGQFTEFVFAASTEFQSLDFTQFDGVSQLFLMAILSENQLERFDWDDFVIRTAEAVTISPVADAGPDFTTTDADADDVESVPVDGIASSDPDGSLTTWTWIEDGLEVGSGAMTEILFGVGRHHVTLQVRDDDGNVALDDLTIQVNPPGGLPFADAGPNQNVVDDGMGTASVSLDGSDSFDPIGTLTSWVWSEFGVPYGGGETLVVNLTAGVHVIELEVTDDDGNLATDTVTISVTPLGGFPPYADAGTNVIVEDADRDGSESVTLDGSGSSDPDGTITSWSWSEAGVALGEGETLAASFSVGVHVVDLVVEDDAGLSGVGSVVVTVEAGTVIDPAIVVGTQTSENTANATTHVLDVASLPIVAGDLLLAHVCADGGSGLVIGCPSGWSEVDQAGHASSGVFGALCMKEADQGDESALSYDVTTSGAQQTQSGVLLIRSHDPEMPIEVSGVRADEVDTSPESPALLPEPRPFSRVLRFMCANGGQVTEGVGFPAGMSANLWLLESADGSSGPVSGGAAIDALGASGPAEWTDALATSQQSVNFSVAIAGREEMETSEPSPVPTLSGPATVGLVCVALALPFWRRLRSASARAHSGPE